MPSATLNSAQEQARDRLDWWTNLRHGGLLLDSPRLSTLLPEDPPELYSYDQDRLRRRINQFVDDPNANRGQLIAFVLESICGVKNPLGTWYRGAEVSKDWSRKTITGESVRPNHLWKGKHDSLLPVFIEKEKRVGIGRGKKLVSNTLQWLRQTGNRLAIVTNGHEWRLLYAGLDYEAHVQWDLNQWFTNGEPSDELCGFRSLVNPDLWTAETEDAQPPLLAAINESRKGQAELSQVLGERVRQAVELLIQSNAPAVNAALDSQTDGQTPVTNTDIYRAGVRFIMRMVVVLFAESRERLLPRDNPTYHDSYSLGGLRDQLLRQSPHRQRNNFAAFPRIISLFNLIYHGSPHPDLTISRYGGDLFCPGDADSHDGMIRALHILENGCYSHDVMNDAQVASILDLLSQTKIKIRQGRSGTWVPSPVDFSSLDSEYIGILYEGLLDFELRRADEDNPIIFLAVGNQPALPLSSLEAMDDKALKNLLDKMKDTSSGGDEEEADASDEDPSDDQDGEDDEQGDESDADSVSEDESDYDVRKTMRARAESWAHRAIEAGKLVKKPRGTMTEEKRLAYQAAIDRKAGQIVTQVVLPGEWYLIRWGGTRKGSGTFYTRPQLAIPTVHRTLFPLAYEVDEDDQSKASINQPPIPKKPEEILNLKVCDPACGSGSFPLAALRFLTEALFASLHYHNRIEYFSDRTVIDLIRDETTEQTLAGEALPCRPEDIDFEPRTKAVLRRHVVERCIYGVDLDPLAVELCRLSLWLETLDPRLPFTFLDHKIKCGNALVGTWFDQFMHYPPMAWMREGGDKTHSNGVHFEKEAWTKAIKAKVKDVKKELIDYIDGAKLIYKVDLSTIETVHDAAEQALQEIHQLGIHEVDQRAERYRVLRESKEFLDMKFGFDLWCSIWFWPPDDLPDCPMPIAFYENELSARAKATVTNLATERRFFHWELEYPDVFNQRTQGFDAVLGNPPWDTAKPFSKEFFSVHDPLYRTYGKRAAVKRQTEMFQQQEEIERDWLRYNSVFRAQNNWVRSVGHPFGNLITEDSKGKESHDLGIGDRGKSSFSTSENRHVKWQQKREELSGYADAEHTFRHQGSGDLNLYKMFTEQAHAILREGGRLGMILPSGIYSDKGTTKLRTLFLEHCSWEWIFGFENRNNIFDIHRSFKFNPIIVEKGSRTTSVKTAFMRRELEDWESLATKTIPYPIDRIHRLSPKLLCFVEITTEDYFDVLDSAYEGKEIFADQYKDGWTIDYGREFHMTDDAKHFPPLTKWVERGFERNGESDYWVANDERAMPLYEGRMIRAFDYSAQQWVSGKGRQAVWEDVDFQSKRLGPQYLMDEQFARSSKKGKKGFKLGVVNVSSATNSRSLKCSFIPHFPCGNSINTLQVDPNEVWRLLFLQSVFCSFAFDFLLRLRFTGVNINAFLLGQCALPSVPDKNDPIARAIVSSAARLTFVSPTFSNCALRLQEEVGLEVPMKLAALCRHERRRLKVINDALIASCYGLSESDLHLVLSECDIPSTQLSNNDFSRELNPKGFWRVALLDELEGKTPPPTDSVNEEKSSYKKSSGQGELF